MATKGILLCRLPRLLGGDVAAGERLLRRVVAEDPTAINSRLMLAKQCASRGEHDEAREYAARALQIAREQGRADAVAEAQATLAQLDPTR
jgi:Tfp pilus assembly protein PilF